MDQRARGIVILSALASLPLILTLNGLMKMFSGGPFPPGWGGDAYGHLFKIWKLYSSGYHPWIDDWYSGYPFLRFYPPLSYFLAWAIAIPLGDPALAYKLVITLSLILSSLSAYLLGRELEFSEVPSTLMGLSFSTNPWLLRMISPEGNFPRVVAASIAPLFLVYVVRLAKEREGKLWYALPIATLLLTHHSLAVVLLPLAAVLWLSAFLNEPLGPEEIVMRIGNTIRILLWSLAVSSFWLVPFLLERNLAHFLKENAIESLFIRQSVPLPMVFSDSEPWSYYQGVLRISLAVISLPITLGLLKRYRREQVSLSLLSTFASSFLVFLSLLLSLGARGPVPWLNRLPLLDMIPPYRWLDLTQLSATVALGGLTEIVAERLKSMGDSLRGGRFLPLIILLLIIPLSAESSSRQKYLGGTHFDGDLMKALSVIREDPSIFRFHQQGLIFTLGSMVSLSPAIAHKPSLDGWYRQGDPLYPQHNRMEWEIENGVREVYFELKAFGIKYILLDLRVSKGYDFLRELGFEEVARYGSIVVLKWDNGVIGCPCEWWIEEWRDGYIRFRYASKQDTEARISEAWYPYWKLRIDGRDADDGVPKRDDLGLIHLALPQGEHEVELRFEDPLSLLRVISLAIVLYIIIKSIIPKKEDWRRPWEEQMVVDLTGGRGSTHWLPKLIWG